MGKIAQKRMNGELSLSSRIGRKVKKAEDMGLGELPAEQPEPSVWNQALQGMADYEKENPLGSALSFAGNVVAGKTARGFKQAESLGRVFGGAADALPRFEINDAASQLKGLPDYLQSKKLSDVLDHPELYKNYPELADMDVQKLLPSIDNYDRAGQFSTVSDKPVIRVRGDMTSEEIHSSLLHEIQHAIQDREGFEQGTHGSSPGYAHNMGEAEARTVQKNMHMSPATTNTPYFSNFFNQMNRMRS